MPIIMACGLTNNMKHNAVISAKKELEKYASHLLSYINRLHEIGRRLNEIEKLTYYRQDEALKAEVDALFDEYQSIMVASEMNTPPIRIGITHHVLH